MDGYDDCRCDAPRVEFDRGRARVRAESLENIIGIGHTLDRRIERDSPLWADYGAIVAAHIRDNPDCTRMIFELEHSIYCG